MIKATEHEEFGSFLERNGVSRDWYDEEVKASSSLARYLRVNPRSKVNLVEVAAKLEEEIANRSGRSSSLSEEQEASREKVVVSVVPWVRSFLSIPGNVKIKGIDLYENGVLYGMDVASGFAVQCLDPQPGEKVLDLCCAPGAKFCMIADLMQHRGVLVGVDAARDRANTCVSICKKYRVCERRFEGNDEKKVDWEAFVVEDDGVHFQGNPFFANEIIWDSHADEVMYDQEQRESQAKRRRLNRGLRRKVGKVRTEKKIEGSFEFDRVIVDAECTHDGSLRHMEKYGHGGVFGRSAFQDRFLGSDNCKYSKTSDTLQSLQRGLLENGFRLLKPGGTLVYSTCSFCRTQNEDIVKWLLDTKEDAELVNLVDEQDADKDDLTKAPYVASEIVSGTIQFTPRKSGTSGLFLAKLTKKK